MWDMFRVKKKGSRTTSVTPLGMISLNDFKYHNNIFWHFSFLCLYIAESFVSSLELCFMNKIIVHSLKY